MMSSSWNFPTWAEPSYEGSEPSWGTLIFELKPSWHYWQYVSTVKLGNKERFDKEQIGVKEPFPVTNCQFTS